ncbi:MAG: sterol desaturase family protein [Pseudomonadota bacterium]
MNTATIISLIPLFFFGLCWLGQSLLPKREQVNPLRSPRVGHNLLLFCVNLLVTRLVVPLSLVTVALFAAEHPFGLFHLVAWPQWIEILLAVILLDMAIYWQHVATHKIPLLWQMHKVHHADEEMDVTTAVRFHPFELVLSLGYKALVIYLLGVSAIAVSIFVLLLFIGPAFNHSNIALPKRLDTMLRWVIATPDTHRTHHSTVHAEQDMNFGFFLIWWDRLFGTYQQDPLHGHEEMQIGLPRGSEPSQVRVDQMLAAPFYFR